MNRMLVAGVAAIVAAGLAPHALDAWRGYRLERLQEERKRFIALKDREIACLEDLASNFREGMDVKREIERCKQLAIDPETGDYARLPP